MRLLLVEDDTMIGEVVLDLLRAEHYAVDWVKDGEMADTALRQSQSYDLVMLDLGLPRKDGLEVLRAMRARKDRTPVLIATARDAVDQRVAGLDAGAEYQLTPHILLNGSVSYIRLLSFRNSDPTQKALLLNVPELKLKASLTLQDLGVKNSFVRLFGRYQSAYAFTAGRWDSSLFFQDGKVPARFVADLGVGYTFDNGLAVSANVFNLLDDQGVEVLGAAPTGRSGYVQLAYSYEGLNF